MFDIPPPTASAKNPITINGSLNIPKKEVLQVEITYYNKEGETQTDATIGFTKCVRTDGLVPEVTTTPQDVAPNESVIYALTIEAGEMLPGDYICELVVYLDTGDGYPPPDVNPYYRKQQLVTITSSLD